MRCKTSPDTSGSKKQSSNRKGPRQLFYTEAFKQKIVNEVLSGKLSKQQASLIYGIKGNATILYWINQSRGLKGYEAKAKSVANFAEMKRTSTTKNWKKKIKSLKSSYGWPSFVPTCGSTLLKHLKKSSISTS